MAAFWNDVLEAARDLVAALPLAGLPDDNVVVRKLPGPADVLDVLPLVTVCPAPVGETEEALAFDVKNVVYPVQFTIIRAGDGDLAGNLEAVLTWRQQIRALFHLSDALALVVPSVWRTEFIARAPLDRRLVNQNYDYSAFIIRFSSREYE